MLILIINTKELIEQLNVLVLSIIANHGNDRVFYKLKYIYIYILQLLTLLSLFKELHACHVNHTL